MAPRSLALLSLILVLAAQPARAGVGDTAEQCGQSYGKPEVVEAKARHIYRIGGMTITTEFIGGKAAFATRQKARHDSTSRRAGISTLDNGGGIWEDRRVKSNIGVIVGLALMALGIASGEVRTWTDTTGKFKIEAEFVSLEGGEVTLRGTTGKTKKIPLEKLSAADRKVAGGLAAAGKVSAGKTGSANGELGSGEIGKSATFDLPGGEKMVMKYCPGGKFKMGIPEGEKGRRGNEAQVEVELSSHYWMAETECTQAQWEALMGNNPSKFKGKRLPVETVSWNDAQAYVAKLNEKVKPPKGWRWSLPTEVQWERACRAGTTTAFSFGDDDKELTDYAWFSDNSERRTHPVGTKKPNQWGLHDMHGNLFEWCQDSWDEEAKLPGGIDPLGTQGSLRVSRGGGWFGFAFSAHCDSRLFGDPVYACSVYGIRAVLAPGQP